MRTCAKASSFIVLTLVLCLLLLTPQLCRADTVSSGPLSFQTSNQSMWSSGTDAVNYQIFNVNQPINVNDTLGSISTTTFCILGSCVDTGSYGVQVGANINGNVGANLNLTLTAGSVNAAVPVNVALGFPSTVATNTPFNITSSGLFQPGASLTTQSPGINLSMNVITNLAGGISAEECFGGCASQAVSVNTNGPKTTNLFTTNLLGLGLGKSFNISPYFVAEADLAPYVGTSATTTASSDASTPLTLSSSALAKSPFIAFNADVTNAIAAGLRAVGVPLPNLDGSFATATGTTVNYDLVRFLAGVGLNATQSFTLSATPEVAYAIQDVGSNPQTFTTNPMPVGSAFTYSIPSGDTAADVTPIYSMEGSLANTTGVVPTINLEVQALGLQYGSIGVQHLLDLQYPIPLNGLEADFFNQDFALQGWNTIHGTQFDITATNPTPPAPEPPTLLLLGASLLLMTCLLRYCIQAKVLDHHV